MNLTLGTIDLDALDVDQLRAHRDTLERGIRIIDALTTALDPAAPPPATIAPPAAAPEPEPQRALPPAPEPEPPAPVEPEPEPPRPEPAAGDGRHARSLKARADVAAALKRLPAGEWVGSTAVAAEAGVSTGTTAEILRELLEAGELEHNGKGGAWSKYRSPGDAGPELEQDLEPDLDDDVVIPPPTASPHAATAQPARAQARGDGERAHACRARAQRLQPHRPPGVDPAHARGRRAHRPPAGPRPGRQRA